MTLPAHIRRILLIGLMGSGKTTVGRLLAATLDWSFVDLDQRIEQESGQGIADIFAGPGEREFRKLESRELIRALTQDRVVVSCGGGIILSEANRIRLHSEQVVWLQVSAHEAAARVKAQAIPRPLLKNVANTEAYLSEVLNRRASFYRMAATFSIHTDGKMPELIHHHIIQQFEKKYDTA